MPQATSAKLKRPPRANRQRTYSDAERAEALAILAANGGNLQRASNDTGIPRKTLELWRNGRLSPPRKLAVEELLPSACDDAATIYELGSKYLALKSLDPEKVDKSSTYQLAIASCAMADKGLLLRGLPNHITATRNDAFAPMTTDQLRDLLAGRSPRTVDAALLSATTTLDTTATTPQLPAPQ